MKSRAWNASTIAGELQIMDPHHDYTLRVLPFPVPRDFMNRWLGVIYGQTRTMTTLKKSVSFHGETRRLGDAAADRQRIDD